MSSHIALGSDSDENTETQTYRQRVIDTLKETCDCIDFIQANIATNKRLIETYSQRMNLRLTPARKGLQVETTRQIDALLTQLQNELDFRDNLIIIQDELAG